MRYNQTDINQLDMPRRRRDGSLDTGKYTGAITSQYRSGSRLDDRFRVSNFTQATFISGKTLERYWHRPDLYTSDDPDIWYFLRYTPTINMVDNSCDHCVTRHHYLKLSCSMTRNIPTRYTDPTVL